MVSQRPPRFRLRRSRGKELKILESGFDALEVLAKSRKPMTVSEMMKGMERGKHSVKSGYVVNALLVLHKDGAVEGDGKFSRWRVGGDLTKIAITPYGLVLMKERKARIQLVKRLLEGR